MQWLIFALLSAAFAALVAIFGKIGLQNVDSHTATAIRAVVMAVFLIVIVLVEGKLNNFKTILINNKAVFYIVLSGIAGALSWLFYFVALKGAKVSQIVPIDRLSVVFALLLAFLFLHEKITWQGWLGAGLVVVGGVLIALGK
ncbi:EamA family transporter [archaeon]|nr:EamA family transporter [archaeon]